MPFSLGSFFGNLIHLKKNELGHSALGNSIVDTVDNVVDPLLGSAVSSATVGVVNPTSSSASANTAPPSAFSAEAEALIAMFLQALLNSHYQSTGQPIVVPGQSSKSSAPTPAPTPTSANADTNPESPAPPSYGEPSVVG